MWYIDEMENPHLILTIIKIERECIPSEKLYLGLNKNFQIEYVYPRLIAEATRRGILPMLNKMRIADAQKHGDVRRLVKAVAEQEKTWESSPPSKEPPTSTS